MIIEDEEMFFIDYEDDDSKIILYAPLRSYLALIKKELMNLLLERNGSEERDIFLSKLKARRIINLKKITEDIHNSVPELSLALTENCNLKCVYCHASAGDSHKLKTMPKDLVDIVIKEYFKRVPQDTGKVYIHIAGGGEPTYDFSLLKYSLDKAREYAEKKGVKHISFSLPTNGAYGDNIREYLKKNFDSVSLSFDGPDYIQNAHRPLKSGKESFDIVFETAKYFHVNHMNYAFRTTVSAFSLPYLKAIVDFFIEHFPNVSVGFEPLIPTGRGSCSIIKKPDSTAFGDGIIEVLKYAKGKPIKISNSASCEFGNIRPIFCSSVGIPNWTVGVDGGIYCCAREGAPDVFHFGRFDFINHTVELDNDKIERIRNMNVLHYEECTNCFCKYHCAGDCPDRRLAHKSDCNAIRKIGQHVLSNKISS